METGVGELLRDAVDSGRVTVTDDAAEAVEATDISFICVGTPSQSNGGQDLTAVERLADQLGKALAAKDGYHLVVMRSTVLPGTVDAVVRTRIESASGKQQGKDFDVCFQPEFLREGSSIKDYDNPPFTVVGVASERASEMLREVYGHLPGEFISTTVATAEMLKYACNVFHALKITFANEIGRLSQAADVDPHAVMDLVCRDKHLNISGAYLRPGFAFGGSCLPKDLRAMLHLARGHDVELPMLSGIIPSNRLHVDHAVDYVLASGRRRVGLIGLSFKSGTDDLRESPLVEMAERFIGKGLNLSIYDPEVHLARLTGANRRYIEETIPHISSLMTDDCEGMLSACDVVVVGLNDDAILQTLYNTANDSQLILDLVNVRERHRLAGEYHGVCW